MIRLVGQIRSSRDAHLRRRRVPSQQRLEAKETPRSAHPQAKGRGRGRRDLSGAVLLETGTGLRGKGILYSNKLLLTHRTHRDISVCYRYSRSYPARPVPYNPWRKCTLSALSRKKYTLSRNLQVGNHINKNEKQGENVDHSSRHSRSTSGKW